jgi:hypothetical protein
VIILEKEKPHDASRTIRRADSRRQHVTLMASSADEGLAPGLLLQEASSPSSSQYPFFAPLSAGAVAWRPASLVRATSEPADRSERVSSAKPFLFFG